MMGAATGVEWDTGEDTKEILRRYEENIEEYLGGMRGNEYISEFSQSDVA